MFTLFFIYKLFNMDKILKRWNYDISNFLFDFWRMCVSVKSRKVYIETLQESRQLSMAIEPSKNLINDRILAIDGCRNRGCHKMY